MAITYPVDVENTRWSILQISTGQIVGRNKKWPRADGGEIVGADPDYVYLLQSSTEQPQYDSRLYTLEGNEEVSPEANTIGLRWEARKRPLDEQKQAAMNEEAYQFTRHFPVERVALETTLMVGLIYTFAIDGQTIPLRFRAFADKFNNKVKNKILPNRDRLDQLLAQLEDPQTPDPDLDAEWAEPDA